VICPEKNWAHGTSSIFQWEVVERYWATALAGWSDVSAASNRVFLVCVSNQ
jgi:hypothetical protein